MFISSKDLAINEEIRDKEVRLIGEQGEQLGIFSAREALALAEQRDLDLVRIAPKALPPVCKIMDYGKYKFELAKKEKEARKNQHIIEIKEVRMSLVIGDHDLQTKVNHVIRMLGEGDKVKVSVNFRSREMSRTQVGRDLLERVAQMCSEVAVVERPSKMEGRNMSMFLAAK